MCYTHNKKRGIFMRKLRRILIFAGIILCVAGCNKEASVTKKDQEETKSITCTGNYLDNKETYEFTYDKDGKVIKSLTIKTKTEIDPEVQELEAAAESTRLIMCDGEDSSTCKVETKDNTIITTLILSTDNINDYGATFTKDTPIDEIEKSLNEGIPDTYSCK